MAQIAPFPGTGIDKETGRVLSGWPHVMQSLLVIWTTPFGARVLRRWFGSFIPPIIGRNMDPPTVLRFWTAICVAVSIWEPRYRITKITPGGTSDEMRLGNLSFAVDGIYYPRGHLGDFTPDGPRRIAFRQRDSLQWSQL